MFSLHLSIYFCENSLQISAVGISSCFLFLISPLISAANRPPALQAPQDVLQTFVGENFVYQLTAVDPEGSALLFQLESGPLGASISPAGLLIWTVQEEQTHSFRFSVTDECDAQSRFTTEVRNTDACRTEMSFHQTSLSFVEIRMYVSFKSVLK